MKGEIRNDPFTLLSLIRIQNHYMVQLCSIYNILDWPIFQVQNYFCILVDHLPTVIKLHAVSTFVSCVSPHQIKSKVHGSREELE